VQIYNVPGEGYFEDVIRTYKYRTLTRHVNPTSVPAELYEPQPISQYLVARTDDGTRVIGLAEAHFFDQMHAGYSGLAPGIAVAVEPLCPFDKLTFFQTIYVEPEFRSQPAYLYLTLAMIYLGVELGAKGGLCYTGANSEFHRRLYEKTGGRRVGPVEISYPDGTCVEDVAYYFDLRAVCAHPRMARMLERTHFDMNLARDTYNWRYDVSSPADPVVSGSTAANPAQ